MALSPADEALLQGILDQCLYALGSGAKMPIHRIALQTLRKHTRGDDKKGFELAIFKARNPSNPNDTDPGEPRWQRDGNFILACCELIGSMAAADAKAKGKVAIDTAILTAAYNKVSAANNPPVPGEFCPAFP
jgi:hypothetical protein